MLLFTLSESDIVEAVTISTSGKMPADFDFSFELIGWNEFELNLVDHWLSSAFNENRNGCFL